MNLGGIRYLHLLLQLLGEPVESAARAVQKLAGIRFDAVAHLHDSHRARIGTACSVGDDSSNCSLHVCKLGPQQGAANAGEQLALAWLHAFSQLLHSQ